MGKSAAKPLYKKLFSKTLIIFYLCLIVFLLVWEITDPTLPYEETIMLSLEPGTIAVSDNHFDYDPLGASQPMIRFTPNLRHLSSDIYPTANASIYELRWMSLTGEQQSLLLNMDFLLINAKPASTLLAYDSNFLRYWDFRAYQFSTQDLPCWPYTIEVLDGFHDNNMMELNITFALPDLPIFCIPDLRNGG